MKRLLNALRFFRSLFSTDIIRTHKIGKHEFTVNYAFLVWMAWLVGFLASSYCLVNYEFAMNNAAATDVQRLFSGVAQGGQAVHTTNLWNEGILGYAFLSAIGVSAYMWIYQWRLLSQSLGYSGSFFTFAGGEKV